jgi:DNA-binding response OmpR family regulator
MEIDSKNNKIAIVDRDESIVDLLLRFLKFFNYQVETAIDEESASQVLTKFKPDLVILDPNLANNSEIGLQLCREISSNGTLVLILSSLRETKDILAAFESGADDYISKPFELEILRARIIALLKRRLHKQETTTSARKYLVFDKLVIDYDKCEVRVKDRIIHLSALEFDLLLFLANHPYQIWQRSELIQKVWNKQDYNYERKVDVHLGQIRRKIGDRDGKLIKTVRSKGYMFNPPASKNN